MRVEGKELALRTTRKSYRAEANEVIFSLSVSNQLLFHWHRMVHKPRDYIPLLNSSCGDTSGDDRQTGDNHLKRSDGENGNGKGCNDEP